MSHVNEGSDPIVITLSEFVDHPSSLKTKEYFSEPIEFTFLELIPNNIENKVMGELQLIFEFFKFPKFVLNLSYLRNLLNFKGMFL